MASPGIKEVLPSTSTLQRRRYKIMPHLLPTILLLIITLNHKVGTSAFTTTNKINKQVTTLSTIKLSYNGFSLSNASLHYRRSRKIRRQLSSNDETNAINDNDDALKSEFALQPMMEDNTQIKTNVTEQESRSIISKSANEEVGIGGKGGIVYDVNKLKRNLVQEALRESKRELLVLLSAPPTLQSEINEKIKKNGKKASATTPTSSSSSGSTYWMAPKNTIRENEKRMVTITNARDKAIEAKIASLVQANPVSTTTDSNLLEGMWDFAFVSDQALKILNESRFVSSKSRRRRQIDSSNEKNDYNSFSASTERENRRRRNLKYKIKNGDLGFFSSENVLSALTRLIRLENLDDDEDPHVVDSKLFLNGLWRVERHWGIARLTRTSLEMELNEQKLYVCGKLFRTKDRKKSRILSNTDLQILYLDSDLCISTTGQDSNYLYVHTKSEMWSKERARRKIKSLISSALLKIQLKRLLALVSFWRKDNKTDDKASIKKSLELSERKQLSEKNTTNSNNRILVRKTDANSDLTVWRLGGVGERDKDDDAWDGEEDPFVHLTATERQELMKKMSIEEIEEARRRQKRRSANKKGFGKRKRKQFKRPEE